MTQTNKSTERATEAKIGIFFDNSWHPSDSNRTIPVINPTNGNAFTEIAAGNAADIDRAVRAARAAFDGAWGQLSATERGRLLSNVGLLILEHFDELATLEALDTGKPMKQAKADITAAARYFEYYDAAADKVHGETIPFMNGFFVTTEHLPHGVT